MAELVGRQADVYWIAEDASGTSMTNEACSDKGTTPARTIYQIDSGTKRYWKSGTITVETSPDGVVWSTVTDYQLGLAGGLVVFNTQRASGTQVRVSGTYFTPSAITRCHSWTANVERGTVPSTTFGATWETFRYTLSSGTVTVERYPDGTAFFETLWPGTVGGLLVLYLNVPGNVKIEVDVNLVSHGIKPNMDGLVTETATFRFLGPMNWANA